MQNRERPGWVETPRMSEIYTGLLDTLGQQKVVGLFEKDKPKNSTFKMLLNIFDLLQSLLPSLQTPSGVLPIPCSFG